MSRALLRYVDEVVEASARPAARALAPVLREVEEALDAADGYAAADAALRRLEGSARADGLEGVLVGAMMNGTSAGAVDVSR
jgi:hypothetical protein